MSDGKQLHLAVPRDEYIAIVKDAERYRWLKKHVVFLHQSVGEDREPEWSIHGDWPGYEKTEAVDFKSLDEAIDKAMKP